MESFIYPELKKASLNKDESRIPTLGPYAAVLSFIIRNANISSLCKQNKQDFFSCQNRQHRIMSLSK